MLGDDRFRKAARVVDDAKNDEGTYASDSDAALAQSARAALVPFVVFIMARIRLSGRSPTSNDRRYDEVSGQLGASSSVALLGCQKIDGAADTMGAGAGRTEVSPRKDPRSERARKQILQSLDLPVLKLRPRRIEVGQRCRSVRSTGIWT